jgi:hypothetical protein
VQVRERVVDFAPIVEGFARTSTVQVLPDPRFELLQESFWIEKSVEFESTGDEHPVADPAPLLVRVKLKWFECAPALTEPKEWERGAQARAGITPVTVIWFVVVEAVPPVEQLRVRVVVRRPSVPGLPRITIKQAPEAGMSLAPQLSEAMKKSVEFERVTGEQPVATDSPVLVRVKVIGLELVSRSTCPKS